MNLTNLANRLGREFRKRRINRFVRDFDITANTRVLDLGGTTHIWSQANILPQLTIVNLTPPLNEPLGNCVHWVVADAVHLPFPDKAFDVVFCNSLIEHLMNRNNQRCLAQEIGRVAHRYFVQTPNMRFPVDMHMMVPLFHWLPKTIQRWLAHFTVWGILSKASRHQGARYVDELCLFTEKELQQIFPLDEIGREYFFGMVKSCEIKHQ